MSATPPQATWNKLETKGILRSQENRSTIAFLPVVRNFNETKPKSKFSYSLFFVAETSFRWSSAVGSILQSTRLIYCFITIIHLFAAVAAAARSRAQAPSSIYLSSPFRFSRVLSAARPATNRRSGSFRLHASALPCKSTPWAKQASWQIVKLPTRPRYRAETQPNYLLYIYRSTANRYCTRSTRCEANAKSWPRVIDRLLSIESTLFRSLLLSETMICKLEGVSSRPSKS
mgnify:CR=1 FL=1